MTTPEPPDPDADVPGDGSGAAPESAVDDLVEIYREADLDRVKESDAADTGIDADTGSDVCPLDAPATPPDDAVTPVETAATDMLAMLADGSPADDPAADAPASDAPEMSAAEEDECDADAAIEPALAEAAAETAFVGDVAEDDDIALLYDDEPTLEAAVVASTAVEPAAVNADIVEPAAIKAPVIEPVAAEPVAAEPEPASTAAPPIDVEPTASPEPIAFAADDVLETSTYLAGAMILTGTAPPATGIEPRPAPMPVRRDRAAALSAEQARPAAAVPARASADASVIALPKASTRRPRARPAPTTTAMAATASVAPTARVAPSANAADAEDLESSAESFESGESFEPRESFDATASWRATSSDDSTDDDRLIEPSAVGLETDEDDRDADLAVAGKSGGWWSIPLLCLGVAIVACCMVIPQADANRRLAYQRTQLRAELEAVQAQVATNDEFLRKLATDPTLAERLAQRQMKMMRSGVKPLPVSSGPMGTSPFELVQVPRPAKPPPYEPIGGRVASLTYHPRGRLYLMGGGLLVLAAALVLGVGGRARSDI